MTEVPQGDPLPEKSKNVFERIVGVLFAPSETFRDIVRRPDIIGPLLVIVILGYISTALIMPKFDFETMMAQQAEEMSRRGQNMTEDQRAQMERITMAGVKVFSWVLPLLMVAAYAIIAGVLLLAFRILGGEGTFKQAFSITLYSWMPMVLLGIITTIIVLARGSFDPVTAATLVKSNPAFLVDMKEQPVLFSLLSSLDLFTIWTLALLIIGFATMARVSKAKAAAIVISLWLAWVLVKAGIAAIGASRK